MYIQYTGFKVSQNSRMYSFQVLDAQRESREFTVNIPSDTDHWVSLKLQDGPGICFERLEQELSRETATCSAQLNLQISEGDIRNYLARQNPKKAVRKDLPEPSAIAPPILAPSLMADRTRAKPTSDVPSISHWTPFSNSRA